MGLISKISRDEKNASKKKSETARAPAEGAPHQSFTCPQCGSVAYWLDVYGGGPHCQACRPPPGRSSILEAHGASDGTGSTGEQPPPGAAGEPIDPDTDDAEDAEFHRQWREYLTGTQKNPRLVIQRRDFKFTEPMAK